ncbi:MAG: GTPase HflX [Bdellovibrionales bacterium]
MRGQVDALHQPEAMLDEAIGLAQAIQLEVMAAHILHLSTPVPATLLGTGQVEALAELVEAEEIDVAIIDHALTPIQQRNLEKKLHCKVIDRTGLILEIFGARARTKEGKLQVELAALNYQKSRLVRSWTHLERQRGGFGFMGGPGESQLEVDRRLIMGRITKLKKELEQVRRTRGLGRQARERAGHPTIVFVGYTNAGKSTLFNQLTGSEALAKDMLFATLDPHMRGIKLPSGAKVILSDTVGFISDLPTHLVEAFRATLEEVQLADVILHVRDITHPQARLQKQAVEDILYDLGIEPDDNRLIEVMNKADLLPEDERENLYDYAARRSREAVDAPADLDGLTPQARAGSVAISALTGEGIENLLALIDDYLARRCAVYDIEVPINEGAALAWLYGHGRIEVRKDGAKKVKLRVALDSADFGRFISKFEGVVHVKC